MVLGAMIETVVLAVENMAQRCLRLLDLLDAVVELAQFVRCHDSPVCCGSAGRTDECRDLGQRETGRFEQVDERDLFDRALVVEPFASHAPGNPEQALAFVEAQGR